MAQLLVTVQMKLTLDLSEIQAMVAVMLQSSNHKPGSEPKIKAMSIIYSRGNVYGLFQTRETIAGTSRQKMFNQTIYHIIQW
ncbi:hypothetical protein GP2143_06125 [marine gamma proteobacterium HTCC2143]|jgi:hypothetical protein|uniref:Uncharacterized protein n=1 Tax=marine gamma proteobacterium HTCC2143 TaxID=247633 RepID=A0YBS5_9GAMM|nr:hypothetical protein GP2143_06125 [marine gamma proteobacterium HTCC2143]